MAREILRYVERDRPSPEGAFYSATGADSTAPSGRREEGWFFTWTPPEPAKPPPAVHEVVRVPIDEQGREIEAP